MSRFYVTGKPVQIVDDNEDGYKLCGKPRKLSGKRFEIIRILKLSGINVKWALYNSDHAYKCIVVECGLCKKDCRIQYHKMETRFRDFIDSDNDNNNGNNNSNINSNNNSNNNNNNNINKNTWQKIIFLCQNCTRKREYRGPNAKKKKRENVNDFYRVDKQGNGLKYERKLRRILSQQQINNLVGYTLKVCVYVCL